ncbi:hypothetical protein [Haladaptatus salinisoli]|uniref:hypothetical protein n=1 Tax=Haladaptatus salinisoli TaxID=2884876 RepID=UPI001D0BA30B|nr:hypothetical protein [Haladaptatus salinisoli]
MRISGFNLADYERILDAALEAGYRFYTVSEYVEADAAEEPHVVLRHDVDRRVGNAVALAEAEAERGVGATYYFRTSTFEPDIARAMEDRGHEVGYHYEDLAATRGNVEAAHGRFAENLELFREYVDVKTACAHGSPLSPHLNTDMWEDARTPEHYDLIGEAYDALEFDAIGLSELLYLSDTGRDWSAHVPGLGDVRSTDDVVEVVESGACPALYVLAHPSRWATSRLQAVERSSWDVAAEAGKVVANGAHAVQRAGGRFVEGTRVGRAVRSIAAGNVTGVSRRE